MAEGDFTAPKVRRGRLSNMRTGDYVEFSLNPKSIKEKKGINLAEDAIPGASDPLLRFASGKVSAITFTLQLDGEIRVRKFASPVSNAADAFNGAVPPKGSLLRDRGAEAAAIAEQMQKQTFSIAGEIAFYESFMFPVDPETGEEGGTDRAVFTFGPRYPGVVVVVEDVEVDVTMWSPDLEPVAADLQFTLKRWVVKNRHRHTIWRGGGGA